MRDCLGGFPSSEAVFLLPVFPVEPWFFTPSSDRLSFDLCQFAAVHGPAPGHGGGTAPGPRRAKQRGPASQARIRLIVPLRLRLARRRRLAWPSLVPSGIR